VVQGIMPATNQAVGQTKIIFTVALLYLILGRRFNMQQLLALLLLGCVLVLLASEEHQAHSSYEPPKKTPIESSAHPATADVAANFVAAMGERDSKMTVPVGLAILLSVVIAFNGSLAGVYNEKLLKELRSCIHFQNCVAHVWGSWWNIAYMFIDRHSRQIILTYGFFSGYNVYTWLYILSSAIMGLSVSFIFKYLDNVVRILCVAASIACTLLLSVPLLGQHLTVISVTAIFIIILTLLVYCDGAERQIVIDEQRRLEREAKAPDHVPAPDAGAKEGTGLLASSIYQPQQRGFSLFGGGGR